MNRTEFSYASSYTPYALIEVKRVERKRGILSDFSIMIDVDKFAINYGNEAALTTFTPNIVNKEIAPFSRFHLSEVGNCSFLFLVEIHVMHVRKHNFA